MSIIRVDGVPLQIDAPDIDGDGEIGGVEHVTQKMGDGAITSVNETTELGESLKELNDDSIEPGTRMSGIDMRSNLHHIEVSSILAVDSLVAFKFLPISCLSFTRQKKRLAVSIAALGRNNIVDIVGGKKEHEEKMGNKGFIDKTRNWLGAGNQK